MASVWLLSPLLAETHATSRVEAIRFWSFGDVTRVAIETTGAYKLTSDQIDHPARLYFDMVGLQPPPQTRAGHTSAISVADRLVRQIRVAELAPGTTRIVFDLDQSVEVTSSQLVNPDRLIVELRPRAGRAGSPGLSIAHSGTGMERISPVPAIDQGQSLSATASAAVPDKAVPDNTPLSGEPIVPTNTRSDTPSAAMDAAVDKSVKDSRLAPPKATQSGVDKITAAKIDSAGDRSLVRVFGLKLGKVVIDAGHGGHDTGTVGPHGLMEKDLVLEVALRLGKLIESQLSARVIYTRSEDIFIPLEDRTKIANTEKADLFISIHANSSPFPAATGVETYYFNFNSDKNGLDLATRENASASSAISDLNDLLHKAVLQAKVEESREFAQRVQTSLSTMSARMNKGSRDRGVRKAPFVVLIGATMPSILAEVGFVSNAHDETLMKRSDQRQKIADALFKGVAQYASSLSHVQMAISK